MDNQTVIAFVVSHSLIVSVAAFVVMVIGILVPRQPGAAIRLLAAVALCLIAWIRYSNE